MAALIVVIDEVFAVACETVVGVEGMIDASVVSAILYSYDDDSAVEEMDVATTISLKKCGTLHDFACKNNIHYINDNIMCQRL